MTHQRAKELKQPVLSALKQVLTRKRYEDLFLSIGKDYLRVLNGYEPLVPNNLKVIVSRGVMGRKLAELRNWLYKGVSESPNIQTKVVQQGKAYLRGIEIALTPQQIMECSTFRTRKGTKYPKMSGVVCTDRRSTWSLPSG